ncbi:hypothetical protein [Bradyrhizobium cenepequi]|uniref:hypothetical protein n=1 Tax=Bradyrhizobium cenepequi TaxID=2821403 RepID=UPI001CE2E39E|nr:hypothetical protein [Bradyrhizobium cenepequi]
MEWTSDQDQIDWDALSELYRIAPLGDKKPEDLKRAFANSMYKMLRVRGGRPGRRGTCCR